MPSVRFVAVPALVASLVACGGSAGEPCQEQDDCASGLMCCNSATLGARGTCESSCMARPTPDAGRDSGPGDAQAGDASSDASSDSGMDAGPADSGPADSGPADSGPADSGPADTGSADAAAAG